MATIDEMSEKLRLKFLEIAEKHKDVWGASEATSEKPYDIVTDTFKAWEREYFSRQYRTCLLLLEHEPDEINLLILRDYFLSEYERIEMEYPLPEINFNELLDEINRAFFRLEEYMRGSINWYQYFGFNDAFTKLFYKAKSTNYYSIPTCKLIGEYWRLLNRLNYDFDKSDFENQSACDNEAFVKDCEEISYIQWHRLNEFNEFTTQDEIDEYERKFSIADIHKSIVASQQLIITEPTERSKKEDDTDLHDDKILNIVPRAAEQLNEILKSYFTESQQTALEQLLIAGKAGDRPLVFNGNGNQLSDSFLQLYKNKLLTGTNKKTLIRWIVDNFSFKKPNGSISTFKNETVERTISRNDTPCKNPIIKIENGQVFRAVNK
jgi:hypothetical protein